jgi:hypothetical protein
MAEGRKGPRNQVGALGSMLDLERVRPAIRPVVNDQPVLGVLAADLLIDLGGRRCRPRSQLDQERVSVSRSYRTGSPVMA